MRTLGFFTITGLLLAATACGKPKTEDCTNGSDDDGDGAADCADSECAADASCTTADEVCDDGDDNDGDGDVDCDDSDCNGDPACDTAPSSETDCADQVDNDEDGDVDCADSDCAGPGCRVVVMTETGNATVNVDAGTYDGTNDWSLDYYDPSDGGNICVFSFDLGNAEDHTVDCDSCDFAFVMDVTNSRSTTGDCSNAGLTDGILDGYQYGFGYNQDYTYAGNTYPAVMLYFGSDYGWIGYGTYYGASVSFDGTNFDFSHPKAYFYY